MKNEERSKLSICRSEVIGGFNNLPILTRLEFVRDVLCQRAGEEGQPHFDPTLSLLAEILDIVIPTLDTVPANRTLRYAEPRPL